MGRDTLLHPWYFVSSQQFALSSVNEEDGNACRSMTLSLIRLTLRALLTTYFCSSRPAPAGESTLEDIRREQQQRYRERQSRGFPGSASGTGSVSGQRNDAENDGTNWFWKFWGWGGGTGRNDNDGRGGGNGGSRPRSSRVMTLRDLPQPKRSG